MKAKVVKTKLPKAIKSIVILTAAPHAPLSGTPERVVIEAKSRRKKQSRGLLRILERIARRGAQARAKSAAEYEERHDRSNQKHRDGWLRDYTRNVIRSSRQGAKVLKLSKIFR